MSLVHDGNDPILNACVRAVGRENLDRLLQKAFPNAEVTLTSIRQGLSGSWVFKAYVLEADQGPQISQVVKIGSKEDLDREVENGHIARRFLAKSSMLIEGPIEHDRWTVLVYRFEGASTLGDRLRASADDGQVLSGCQLLGEVFDYFQAWHKNAFKSVLCNLVIDEYPLSAEYFRDFDRERQALGSSTPLRGMEAFHDVEVAREYWSSPRHIFRTWTHACHGDLHTDNVVLDDRGAPCAIDFGHADLDHHFLKDYIAMEADLSFRVLAPRGWRKEALERFRATLEFLHTTFVVDPARYNHRGDQSSRALVCFIATLRRRAWEEMREHDRLLGDGPSRSEFVTEYFLGLLRYAISRTGQPTNRLTESQRWVSGHAANCLEKYLAPIMAAEHFHFRVNIGQRTLDPRATAEREPVKMTAPHDEHEQPLVQRYLDVLNSLPTFNKRLQRNGDLKQWIATYILSAYGDRIFRQASRKIFFESGSSIAYLAKAVNEFLALYLKDESFSIETNNIFACLEFALKSKLQVSLYPAGPPEQTYGATFGPLRHLLPPSWPRDRKWNPDRSRYEEQTEPILEHFKTTYANNGIIFMTASGIECSNESGFAGPHVGSYSNMLFKRALLQSECPIMMVLDEDKIPSPFVPGKCYPVCHGTLAWADVCRTVPLAVAIAHRDVKAADLVIDYLGELGLKLTAGGRSSEVPTGVILANDNFEKRFPEE